MQPDSRIGRWIRQLSVSGVHVAVGALVTPYELISSYSPAFLNHFHTSVLTLFAVATAIRVWRTAKNRELYLCQCAERIAANYDSNDLADFRCFATV